MNLNTPFKELVNLYSQNILAENGLLQTEIKPLYVLTPEDKAAFVLGYEEKIAVYKESLNDYMSLLVQEQDSPNLDDLLFEEVETVELHIEDLVEYRDLFGYDPVVESNVFGLDGYLEFGEYPPTPEILAVATFVMLNNSIDAYAHHQQSYAQIPFFANKFLISTDDLQIQRDIELSLDCREILNLYGIHQGHFKLFERPEGEGKYRIILDQRSNTIYLQSNEVLESAILIESKGRIIESKATDFDASQISKAALLLNADKSKSAEIIR